VQNFVESYLDHTCQYESPGSFWKWSAYAAIAGALRDNVKLRDGDSWLYPNVYILFLAGSAQRKGRPVTMAEHLLHLVDNVKIISGRASIQAILLEIGQTETNTKGVIKPGGSAIFFAPELSAGIVTDDQSIQILTDIYDYKPTGHTTNLIGRGKQKLDKLIFSMLGASNEELLKELYSAKAIGGGLLGRTFLIKADEFRAANAFPTSNEKGFLAIAEQLREISRLKGIWEFSLAASDAYKAWYHQFRQDSRKRDDRSGIFGRLHTNVKKVAVILAANDLSTGVEVAHVEQAIDECVSLIPNYSSFIFASGKSSIADTGAIILTELEKLGTVTKRQLIRENWMHFDPETLDKAMSAFEISGLVATLPVKGDITYKLTDKGLALFGKGNKSD
jgi:hypothetical protein